jgi:hypothetical protein
MSYERRRFVIDISCLCGISDSLHTFKIVLQALIQEEAHLYLAENMEFESEVWGITVRS